MISTVIATEAERPYLEGNFRHISREMFERKLAAGEYLVIKQDETPFGWLRWGYFWDEIPFMNMLTIEDAHQMQGYGRRLVRAWEELMAERGHDMVMTSTLSDEQAQHFYRKLGYTDRGALLLPGETLEIIFVKYLSTGEHTT